ncbi:probable phosphatase phospho2 [Venturia canescens]|uniref:probable phosphatase phospho2 n=1 Tax=Venturia canescens TaxID=32260 RepID=UPI001C9C3BE5|nr:probable phosphatase phospho2 [Venturia canescens]XP_043272945.1 probable phosphatase phospho2 [Venturia canescens]
MMKPLLIAFNFDYTIADDNTGIVIRSLLEGDDCLVKIERIYETECCPTYMRKVFEFIHVKGRREKDVGKAISSIQPVNGFPSLLKKLHSQGVEIIIISDANTYFIDFWLKHHKLVHTIKEIFTNPAWFDRKGLLRIDTYHEQDWCQFCAINMCKGHILDNYVKRRSAEGIKFQKIAYVGNEENDYCPILRLSAEDLAFPRINYKLAKILNENENDDVWNAVKAKILPWTVGSEIWDDLVRIPNLELQKIESMELR